MTNRSRNKMNAKFKQLGQTLGLKDSDILCARRTLRHGITLVAITGIISLFGFLTKQLDPIGQYYASVSINDFFAFWGRFF